LHEFRFCFSFHGIFDQTVYQKIEVKKLFELEEETTHSFICFLSICALKHRERRKTKRDKREVAEGGHNVSDSKNTEFS
jgi:hypothetical protein